MKRRDWLLGTTVLTLGVASGSFIACGPEEIADRRRALLTTWGHSGLLTWYAEAEAQAAALEQAAALLVAQQDDASLALVRDAFAQTRSPWKRAEVFAFGPYEEEPIRIGPKIDFWPARPQSVDQVLANDEPLSSDTVERLGAPAKGFSAIEYLVFGDDAQLLESFSTTPRRGEYLVSLCANLRAKLAELRAAWAPESGNFLGQLVNAGRGGSRFASLHLAIGEVVNRLGFLVEAIRGSKLGKPLGVDAGGAPQPELAESRFSGRSLADVADNLRGIEWLLLGDRTNGSRGLAGYLEQRNRYFERPIESALQRGFSALGAISEPLTVAVESSPDAVRYLIEELGALQRLIQVDILNALSLTIGFSDNDGD